MLDIILLVWAVISLVLVAYVLYRFVDDMEILSRGGSDDDF